MKKLLQIITNHSSLMGFIGLTGILALSLLNIAAFLEYSKYILGLSNRFIVLLPAIKMLLNIDILFIVAIILMYNSLEKVFNPKILLVGVLGLVTAIGLYTTAKDKPMTLILMLGLYGIGISIYASIVGFSLLSKKKTH